MWLAGTDAFCRDWLESGVVAPRCAGVVTPATCDDQTVFSRRTRQPVDPLMTDWLADGIAGVHAGLLLLYFAGAVCVLRGGFLRSPLKRWQRLYLLLVACNCLAVLLTDRCPLTQLENSVRAAGSPRRCYAGSFIGYYFPGIPESVDLAGTLVLLLAGCAGTLQAAWSWLQTTEIKPN